MTSVSRAMTIALAMVLGTGTVPARAADFFAGKTITLLVGAPAGGILDVPGRLVARYWSRHIPGHPNIVVTNMPGAASNIMGRFIFSQAPKDGTTLGVAFSAITTESLFRDEEARGYDPSKLAYLGSAQNYVAVCVARKDSPVKSTADLLSNVVIDGATASGNMTYDFPAIANAIIGAKFKIIKGYLSGPDLMLAVERNELQAACSGWSIIRFKYPALLTDKTLPFIPVLQGHMTGDPELNKAGVPTIASLAKSDLDRRALELFLSQNEYAGPFIAPPETPPDRVAMLRQSFMEAMSDSDFLADAATANMDIAASDGARIQKLVAAAYASPPEVVKRVRDALNQ